MISCMIPPFVSGPRDIRVFVSLNGLEISESSLNFKYVEDPSVFSIFPRAGPITGTTMVSVRGANFLSTSTSVCSFGYHTIPSIVVSSTEVTCIVNPSSWSYIGQVSFRFSSNGQEYSKENVSYFIYENPLLIDLSPRVGSVNGGTKLTFTWDQVIPIEYFGSVSCQIDSTVLDEVSITGKTTTVVVPAVENGIEGPVMTRISFNGQNYADGPQFWYFLEPRIEAIYPNSSGEMANTWIRVTGENFPRLTTLSCLFGSVDAKTVSAEWVSDKLVLCRAPEHRPGTVDFGFSINGVDMIDTNLQFAFTPKTITNDYYPISGPTSGGSELTIPVGVDAQQCHRLHCIVGDFIVIAFMDKSYMAVKCTTPPQYQVGEVSIAIECDGKPFLEFERKFSYYIAPIISDIEPRSMSLTSGGIISVRGRNFLETVFHCRFDSNIVTMAIIVSESEIRCIAPAFSPHAVYSYVTLEISANGMDFTTSGTKIQLTPSLDVLNMSPRHAIINQEVEIVIFTTGLIINPDIFTCRVGEAHEVAAFMASRTSIKCRLPAAPSPGQVMVSVSNNGVDFIGGSRTTLLYHSSPIVHSISQSTGSVFGGENVVVYGRGFVTEVDMVCIFGNTSVSATYKRENSISCLVPPAQWLTQIQHEKAKSSAKIDFKIGVTFGSIVTVLEQESELFWTYKLPVVDVTIYPTKVLTGNTSIVKVKGLDSSSSYKMRLIPENDDRSRIFVSLYPPKDVRFDELEGELQPFVPGRYTVEIEDTGGYVVISQNLLIEVVDPIQVVNATPMTGPVRGDSLVVLEIDRALDRDDLICLFGKYITLATQLKPGTVVCKSPPANNPGRVRLSITIRDLQTSYSDGYEFTYYPDEVITSISPERLIGSQQNEALAVTGLNFYHPDKMVTPLCRIGSTVTRASIVSPSKVICPSALLSSGEYSVSIACDGVNFVTSPRNVTYVSRIWITAVQPSTVALTGGTDIEIKGWGFSQEVSLQCNFGRDRFILPADITSPGTIRCSTPSVGEFSQVLPLSMSSNISTSNELLVSFEAPIVLILATPNVGFSRGGATVKVDVTYVPPSGDLKCFFGDIPVKARRLTSSQIECNSPPHRPESVKLRVEGESGLTVAGASLSFTFLPDLTVANVSPTRGSAAGGTSVVFTLSGAVNELIQEMILCRFGSIFVDAVSILDNLVTCISPLGKQNEDVSMAIALSDQDIAASPVRFQYVAICELISIDPRVGSLGGNVTISALLGDMDVGSGVDYECGFERLGDGITMSKAQISLSGELRCRVPTSFKYPRRIQVSIWQNGERYSTNKLTFELIVPPVIESATPMSIPEFGGALVRVGGTDFSPYHSFMCTFGDNEEAPGKVISRNLLECVSPKLLPGNYSFGVSWNQQENVFSRTSLTVLEALTLESIEPKSGFRDQQREVRVFGAGFQPSASLACRFGEEPVPATYVSRTEIRCNAPLLPSLPIWSSQSLDRHAVSVGVSLDGETFVGSSETAFTYHATPHFDKIYPTSGSIMGGTRILIHGAIDNTLTYKCSFRDESMPAIPLNSRTLSCFTPISKISQRIEVSVEVLGLSIEGAIPLWFTYFNPPTIESLHRTTIKTNGGEQIILSGTNFIPTKALQCQFGDSLVTSPATFISSTTIACITPPRSTAGYVAVEITMNGVDYTTSRQSVYYYNYINVLSVFPEQVSTSGGTELHLELAPESSPTNSLVDCIFVRSTSTITRPAYVASSTELTCFTPMWTPGNAAVGILVNGKQRFMADVLLTFITEPWIHSIHPDHGPTTGGTLVTISGEALDDTAIICMFGEVMVIPSTISKRDVTCTVPSGVNNSTVDVRVAVGTSIRSNVVEFSYDLPIEIFNVSIQRLSEDGGKVLSVTGSNFLNTTELCCEIGAQLPTVKANFIDSTKVRCPIGKARLSQITVGVSNNGYDFAFLETPLKYEVSPYITAVYPVSGPLAGDTPVRITLANADLLKDEGVIFCSFGEQDTRALKVENDKVICISPAVTQPSVVPVSFYWRSNDLEDRFDAEQQNDIEFYYEMFPRLTDISPSSGSAAEGTVLTLSGSEFRDGMIVRFDVGRDARYVPASVVTTSTATVEVPEQLGDGIVSVAISANEVDFRESLMFYVRPRPVLHSVYPSQVSLAPSQTNVTLTIRGTGFNETVRETIRCRIGDDGSPSTAIWVSSAQILCSVPYLDAGIYNVYVALNGVNFVNDGVKILYQEQYVVYGIEPAFGVLGGGTRVQVFGTNFHGNTNDTDLVCAFGTKVSSLQVINASLAECITPSQLKPGTVSFSITRLADINPRYKTPGGLSLYYHKVPTISKILPSMIRATNASSLRLIGANFIDSSLLSCLIQQVPVPARFISSSTIECLLNEMSDGTWLPDSTLSVEVSNNGQDVSNTELQILVLALIRLVRLEPSKGPIRKPLTVKILVENLSSQYQNLKCNIGETQVVAATNLGDGWIECNLPPSPRAGIVHISVSVDGVNYASKSLRFSYDDIPVVYSIYPTSGPFRGGTMVTVQGEGFGISSGLYCVFGSSIVDAYMKSPLTAECVSPAHISGSEQIVSVTVVKADALSSPIVDTEDSI
ncbi:hypothetical protein F443_14283, partial [Phytophthora nicotianae P1569]